MSPRIQLLLEQATRKYDRLGNDIPFAQPDLETFAELIVRECANQVDWILAEGGKTQGALIKQHFGVTE